MLFIPAVSVTNEVTHRRVANVIRRAIDHAYGSVSAACIDMDVKHQSHFNAALDGERGLPVGFFSLSKAFWGWFAVELAAEFGMPRAVRRGAMLMWAALGKKRMARASLRSSERKVA